MARLASEDGQREVLSYASVGTSSVRQRINALRNSGTSLRIPLATLATFTALVARLVDVSATIQCPAALPEADRKRLADLAVQLDRICNALISFNVSGLGHFQPPTHTIGRNTLLAGVRTHRDV